MLAIRATGTFLAADLADNEVAFREVLRFSIILPLTDLDGTAPGQGRPALRVVARPGEIALSASEPEERGVADYSYLLQDAGAAADLGVQDISDLNAEELADLQAHMTKELGKQGIHVTS